MRWQVQEAKQRFSEMLRAVAHDGPQTISRHGQDAFIVLGIDDYRELTSKRRDLVEALLGPPHSDELAAIMDEIERERRSDLPREIELGDDGPGGVR